MFAEATNIAFRFVLCFAFRQGLEAVQDTPPAKYSELDLGADIMIRIRRNVIRIPIADTCIQRIIPIAAGKQKATPICFQTL